MAKDDKGPEVETIGQVEIAVPGWYPMSGVIGHLPNETIELDDVAIQLHELVNDLVMAVRKRGRI